MIAGNREGRVVRRTRLRSPRPTSWRLMFSQVREDPLVEIASSRGRVLMIASGGCTALSLAGAPGVTHIDALDPNPFQIELCRLKQRALRSHPLPEVRSLLGDLPADPAWRVQAARRLGCVLPDRLLGPGILQAGQFERLFASLREFLHRLVCPPDQLERLFDPDDPLDGRGLLQCFDRQFWQTAFTLFFHDELLRTMFGPAAVQHAPKGTYPIYFRRAFERALTRLPVQGNYFLSQVLLGRSIGDVPPYLGRPVDPERVEFHQQDLEQFLSRSVRSPYDTVCLSNVFDWMDQRAIERVCGLLPHAVRRGGASSCASSTISGTCHGRSVGTSFRWRTSRPGGRRATAASSLARSRSGRSDEDSLDGSGGALRASLAPARTSAQLSAGVIDPLSDRSRQGLHAIRSPAG